MEQPLAPAYSCEIIVPLKTKSLYGDNCDINKVTCPNCIPREVSRKLRLRELFLIPFYNHTGLQHLRQNETHII